MKYVINYESGEEICFRPINVNEQPEVIAQGVSDNLPELEIIRGQQKLNEKQLKMIKQNYLPTVSLTGGYSWLTFSNEFNGWLTGSGAYKRWYNTYGIGLQVKIPIFDGFNKRHKRNKAKIDIENTQIALDNNRKNLQKEYGYDARA